MAFQNANFYLSIIIAVFILIMILDYYVGLNFISNNIFIQIIIIIFAISIVTIVLQKKNYDAENNTKEYSKFIIGIINTILIAIVFIAFVILSNSKTIKKHTFVSYQILFYVILIINIILIFMNV